MLQFAWNKIKNKKWLNLCLLIGISLLTALFACHPMFEKGADNQVLQRGFVSYAEDNKEFPAIMGRKGTCELKEYKNVESVRERMKAYEDKWSGYVDVDRIASQQYISFAGSSVNTSPAVRIISFQSDCSPIWKNMLRLFKGKAMIRQQQRPAYIPASSARARWILTDWWSVREWNLLI